MAWTVVAGRKRRPLGGNGDGWAGMVIAGRRWWSG